MGKIMLNNLDFFKSNRKKHKNKNKDKTKSTKGTNVAINDIDGIDINSYSKKHSISLDEIKQKIKQK